MVAIVVPTEMAFFMPRYAALSSGILVGLGAAFNLASPLVGIISDRLGSRRPLLMAGALAVTIALVGMLLSVTGLFGDRTTFSFIFFCVAYLLMQSGITLVSVSFVGFICSVHPNTTAIGYVLTFNLLYRHLLYRHLLYRHLLYRHWIIPKSQSGLIADYGKLLPEKVGTISGIWSLFQLTGATFGYLAAGLILPIKINDHSFYWFLIALVVLSNLGLLRVPPELLLITKKKKQVIIAQTISTEVTPQQSSCSAMVSQWMSHDYGAWRATCLARLVFFFGLGTFSSLGLYFMEDQTDAGEHATQIFTYVALISLGCSLITVWPAGKLSDTFGPSTIAAIGTMFMATVLFILPFLSTTTLVMIVIPFYGIAQQGYNVGDLGLIIQSIPNDDTKARDMGGWSACQNLGMSIGSMFAAAVMTFFHEEEKNGSSPSSSSSRGGGAHEARIPYTRAGYQMVFLPAAAFMFCSVSLVLLAKKRLQTYEWNKKDTTEDSTSGKNITAETDDDIIIQVE